MIWMKKESGNDDDISMLIIIIPPPCNAAFFRGAMNSFYYLLILWVFIPFVYANAHVISFESEKCNEKVFYLASFIHILCSDATRVKFKIIRRWIRSSKYNLIHVNVHPLFASMPADVLNIYFWDIMKEKFT